MTGRVLIVDDEPMICAMLERVLRADGYEIETTTNAQHGLERLQQESFGLVLTDLRMRGMDGLEVLRRAKRIRPSCEVVLMTGFASVQTAREALKQGALDYITKPLDIDGELKPLLANLTRSAKRDRRSFDAGHSHKWERVAPSESEHGIVGKGEAMQALISKIERVAQADAPILLQGESGTGKEVAAGLIHRLSGRADRPFVKVNCAALPETLLESELFGHKRGAFTGATSDREGLFQAADGGTLLLDEIGEISRTFQPKLLRVLQDGEFHRVGDSGRSIRVDVRVVAATNRRLDEAAQRGEFRQDLYYRLNVVQLQIPALRDRIEDLRELIDHFIRLLVERGGPTVRPGLCFDDDVLAAMASYDWPGNIRELQNAVEYAMVLAERDEVGFDDLPVALQDHVRMRGTQGGADAQSGEDAGTLENIERSCILRAMHRTRCNRTQAAKLLGVTRRTLSYRISKYELEAELSELQDLLRRSPRSVRPSNAGATAVA